jgi:uncharacterized membrane protein
MSYSTLSASALVTAYVTTITYDDNAAGATGYYIEQSVKTFSSLEVLANYIDRQGFTSGTMLQPVYLRADVYTGTWGTIESTIISLEPMPLAIAAKYAEMNCG